MKHEKQEGELARLKRENKELKQGWQRARADFLNYQARSEKINNEKLNSQLEIFFIGFLPIIDHFEQSMRHLPKNLENNEWVMGIKYIYRQTLNYLEENDVLKIDVKQGNKFDASVHEAISSEKKSNFKEEEVIEIIESGYKYKEKVIRAAKVKVAA